MEFAIVAPILFALLFGIVEVSLLFNRLQGLHAAAREGARAASLETTTSSQVRSAVDAALVGVSGTDQLTVTVSPATVRPCDQRGGQYVSVTVTSPTRFEVPLVGERDVTLSSTGTFRCE